MLQEESAQFRVNDDAHKEKDLGAQEFGRLMAGRRSRLGWTQLEAADQIGVPRVTLAYWERGEFKYPVAPEMVNRIARVFGLSMTDLLTALGYHLDLSPERIAILQSLQMTAEQEEFLRILPEIPPDLRRILLQVARSMIPQSEDRRSSP